MALLISTKEGGNVNLALLEGGHLAAQTVPSVAPFLPAPNFVTATNPAQLAAANPLTFAAGAIARQGSGTFQVTATSCAFPTGAPVVMTLTLLRDGVALPPVQVSPSEGPGNHTPMHLEWIDTVSDSLPHIYSLSVSAPSGTLQDNATECTVTVHEL